MNSVGTAPTLEQDKLSLPGMISVSLLFYNLVFFVQVSKVRKVPQAPAGNLVQMENQDQEDLKVLKEN